RSAALALAVSWIAVVGDLQRAHSNAFVAGLMTLGWVRAGRGEKISGAAGIAAGAFVKIFPLAAAMSALLHRRWVRFCAVLTGVRALFAALPLLMTGPASLAMQYRSWYAIETADAAPMARYGTGGADLYAGMMGQFRVWFGVDWPHW